MAVPEAVTEGQGTLTLARGGGCSSLPPPPSACCTPPSAAHAPHSASGCGCGRGNLLGATVVHIPPLPHYMFVTAITTQAQIRNIKMLHKISKNINYIRFNVNK